MSTTKKILIVDDDDMLRESLREQFSLHDEFSVTDTANATAGVKALTSAGHDVLVEHDAGAGSGIPDEQYVAAGAKVLATADEEAGGSAGAKWVAEHRPAWLRAAGWSPADADRTASRGVGSSSRRSSTRRRSS